MKKCNKCGEVKPDSEFGKNKRSKDGLHFICKACKRAQDKAWNDQHREQLNAIAKEWRKNNHDKVLALYDKRKQYLLSLKEPCVKCGESRPQVIEFHHRNPAEKSFNLGYAISNGSKPKHEIEEELKKCVFLCANCHAEFHWIYGTNPENPVEALEEYLNN